MMTPVLSPVAVQCLWGEEEEMRREKKSIMYKENLESTGSVLEVLLGGLFVVLWLRRTGFWGACLVCAC